MTSSQKTDFLRSNEFDAACKLAEWPYGFNWETEQKKIALVSERRERLKKEWNALLDKTQGGYNGTEDEEKEFDRVSNADNNASDSAAAGKFEFDSAEYYACAFSTYEMSGND